MAGFNDLVEATSGEAFLQEDFVVRAGSSLDVTWYCEDAEGDPVDLSACTPKCIIRKRPGGAIVYTVESGSSGNITLGDDGIVTLQLTPTETNQADIRDVKGVYDIKITNGSGRVFYLSSGDWTFKAEVSA